MVTVPAETEDGEGKREGGKDLLLVCPLGFWKEPRGGNKRSLPLFTFDLSLVVGRQVHLSSTRIVCVCVLVCVYVFNALGKSYSARSTVKPMRLLDLYFT